MGGHLRHLANQRRVRLPVRRRDGVDQQPVIERLLRRGYLTLAPWPTIVEPGFAEFIRTAPHTASFDDLRTQTSQTVWGQLRTPLLVLVIAQSISGDAATADA
jgi:hypothetical protein